MVLTRAGADSRGQAGADRQLRVRVCRRAGGSRVQHLRQLGRHVVAKHRRPGIARLRRGRLGRGDKWLSSRLFLFAVLLRGMRGLRRLVFVQTTDLSDRVFVASADPNRVQWALAQRCPWLEVALAAAYRGTFSMDPRRSVGLVIMSDQGALNRGQAGYFARQFLDALQQPATMPAPSKAEEWVNLEPKLPIEQPFRERAEWMTTDDVREILK